MSKKMIALFSLSFITLAACGAPADVIDDTTLDEEPAAEDLLIEDFLIEDDFILEDDASGADTLLEEGTDAVEDSEGMDESVDAWDGDTVQ